MVKVVEGDRRWSRWSEVVEVVLGGWWWLEVVEVVGGGQRWSSWLKVVKVVGGG